MAKIQSNFRLSAEAISRLARLTRPGISQADVISDALAAYERQQEPPFQKALLDLYDLAGDLLQPLQYIDEERDLLPEEQQVMDFINRVWDECRRQVLFIEPELPADAWEKEEDHG